MRYAKPQARDDEGAPVVSGSYTQDSYRDEGKSEEGDYSEPGSPGSDASRGSFNSA